MVQNILEFVINYNRFPIERVEMFVVKIEFFFCILICE